MTDIIKPKKIYNYFIDICQFSHAVRRDGYLHINKTRGLEKPEATNHALGFLTVLNQ